MTELILQQFNNDEIRFVPHPEEKYAFGIIADDLACVLEASSGKDIARAVDEEWKGAHNVLTPGGTQATTVIWEPGVYQLLSVSRKPQAKPFQKWVFEEVLPSIRKTGAYSVEPAPQPLSMEEILLHSAKVLVDHKRQLAEQAKALEQQDGRLKVIEGRFESVDREVLALPGALEEVPEKSIRSSLNELLRSYAYRTGESYQKLWTDLYRQYRYHYHVDLVVRAKNQRKTVLAYAEEVGVIDKLYSLAVVMYGQGAGVLSVEENVCL